MKRRTTGALCSSTLLLCLSIGQGRPAGAAPGTFITTIPVVTSGLTGPVGVTHAGDGSGRLFIVQQCGQIRILNGATLLSTPFLDIGGTGTNLITCGGEQGLLGLTFHPNYESNGLFYVYYTRRDNPSTTDNEGGDIVIARYQVSANPNLANAASGLVLLTIEHSSAGNHNGGHLGFGPDGKLYIATGDGGGGGDPFENGQNINTLLGKILRIDVDAGTPYAIPAGNPFAGATPGADEVWDYGLRNPWHFSFDRLTGDLFIGDVGQGAWEEIDRHAFGGAGGVNFGWDCREGAHTFSDTNGDMNVNCDSGFTDPILEYDHSLGCSVTGGSVFRNLPLHSMSGNYFFGDFCSGRIWRGVPGGGGSWTRTDVSDTAFGVSGFGESEKGRMYFTDLAGNTLQWLAPYTFVDVLPNHFAWAFVEAIYAAGITAGCGNDAYCPDSQITRAEMAAFLLLAKEGPSYFPPPCTSPMFNDVPCSNSFAPWINELARRGVTAGCGGGNYCPANPVTRNEMAVFLLATREGAGYSPPACTAPLFSDVPCSSPFARWVNEMARRGITAGCGDGKYCPANPVIRSQMAVFLATTFALPLP